MSYQNTVNHMFKVGSTAYLFGSFLNLSEEAKLILLTSGTLHDIGKLYIDHKIINKIGKLTEEELEIIKKHPEIGYEKLRKNNYREEICEVCLYHHERYDGFGYPHRIKGDKLSNFVKIITIVDSFEAMTIDRSYKYGMSDMEAIKEIEKNLGKQFDPILGEKFIGYVKRKSKH